MSGIPKRGWTEAEYLEAERASEEKHEFLDGEIYLMTGASLKHNLIVGNAITRFNILLRDRSCIVIPSDLRLKITATGLYTYPDISVVCDPIQLEDDHGDTLLNPILIIEVLSPSTERYDRGRKFQHYRALASLREYVLISQDSARVERYLRQPNDEWLLADAVGLEASLELTSIQCTLLLSDVYEKVSFESDETPA